MKVTGYQLREAIKQHTLKRDSLASSFNGTLKVFPGIDFVKDAPAVVMDEFLAAELAVTKLQVAQMQYNLAVRVTVLGERMTLAEAIKRVGGPARAEKMWRSVAAPKRESYYRDDDELDKTKVRAIPTISAKDSIKLAQAAAKQAGAFRAAIAIGNAEEILLDDLSSELFE